MSQRFQSRSGEHRPARVVRWRLLAAVVIAMLMVGFAQPAEAAATGTVIPNEGVNFRSGPGTSYKIVGTAKKGAKLKLECYTTGNSQKGIYGSSTIWYRLAKDKYIADAFIYTGSNKPVTGKCGGSKPKPPSTPSIYKKTDDFVAKHKNRAWDYDGYYGAQCVDLFNYFNRDVVRAGFVPVTYAHQLYAKAPASKYQKLGANATPRKGDVAIYNSHVSSYGTGHVAIVLKVVNGSTLQVIDQNWSGPKATIHNIGKRNLTGYLRPKI